MNGRSILGSLLAVVRCGGCNKFADSTNTTTINPGEPVAAQPPLQTMKLWVGHEEIVVELALNAEQQRTGMMFRTNLAENAGMFFSLPVTQQASFWMKNRPLPCGPRDTRF